MRPVPIDVLRKIADTPPGRQIDIPEAEAAGMVWRMAQALVATHGFVNMVLEQPDHVTVTVKHPEAIDAWSAMCAHLGSEKA